jgi:hypothetical protein
MSKLFLHIGPHKTGSTYIQKYCHDNRDYLLSLGVNYPNIGLLGMYGHQETIRMVKTAVQKELDDYLAQLLVSNVNFVSSENFDRLNLTDLEKLKSALSTLDPLIDVRIIYYYRNYIDLLPSWWQEKIKNGSRISFHEFALPHILRPFSSNIINPAAILDPYMKVFGKDHLTIIDYDLAVERGNILNPILELLGIESGGIKIEIINPSLKLEIIEIIRALNAIAHSNNEGISDHIRLLFLRKRKEEALSGDVEHLAALIRDQMKPLKFAGGFFEKSVKMDFKRKYRSCFFYDDLAEYKKSALLVPSEYWLFTGDAFATCQRIYKYIMTSDQSDRTFQS